MCILNLCWGYSYQESRWGQVPGAFNYGYEKQVTFYSLSSDDSNNGHQVGVLPDKISMATQPSLDFKISRNYTGINFVPSVNNPLQNIVILYSKPQSILARLTTSALHRVTWSKSTAT